MHSTKRWIATLTIPLVAGLCLIGSRSACRAQDTAPQKTMWERYIEASVPQPEQGYGGRLPYPDTKRRLMLGEAFSAMDVHADKEALEKTKIVLQSHRLTPEERFCCRMIRYLAYTRQKQKKEAAAERVELKKAGVLLPAQHELRRTLTFLEKVMQQRLYTPEEGNSYNIVKGDLQVQVPNPVFEHDEDNAMHWLYLCSGSGFGGTPYRMAIAYANRILDTMPQAGPMYKGRALYRLVYVQSKLQLRADAKKSIVRFNALYTATPVANFSPTETFWGAHLSDIAADMRELERSLNLPVTTPIGNARAAYKPPQNDGFPVTKTAKEAKLSFAQQRALAKIGQLFAATGADAGLVLYKGSVIYERYSPRYYPPFGVASATKTWTAILAGMLIAEGKIRSIDDPVAKYVTEWRGGKRDRVTLRHLLEQTSGITSSAGDVDMMAIDSARALQEVAPAMEPGTKWYYSNAGVQLLSLALENAAGVSLAEYAKERLFLPLGMNDTELMKDHAGRTMGFGGGQTTARDMARLTLLLARGGKHNAKQIIPAGWVRDMLHPGNLAKKEQSSYGYLTWLYDAPKGFYMAGDLDNLGMYFLGGDLIVVRMQNESHLTDEGQFQYDIGPLVKELSK